MADLTGISEFKEFNRQLLRYVTKHIYRAFFRFEAGKDILAGALYHKRGKYARPFLHSAMLALIFFGITLGPRLVQASFAGEAVREDGTAAGTNSLSVSLDSIGVATIESNKPWNQVSDYTVKDGDTLSTIAVKFGVSTDSIKWANPNINWQKVKPGVSISVPPVTGIVYKVKPGDTVYSIAKQFQTDPQGIVDFPMNTFSDDETFALVAGQTLIVPDGVMPDATATSVPQLASVTPGAGAASSTGTYVWPAFGRITQPFRYYHPGVDIANHDGGPILAADSGVVIRAGWDTTGYGNMIMLDHGNGVRTLYGHLSLIEVAIGQRVQKGSEIGHMGSTGRSTGTHLHFEIRLPGGNVDPLNYLK